MIATYHGIAGTYCTVGTSTSGTAGTSGWSDLAANQKPSNVVDHVNSN